MRCGWQQSVATMFAAFLTIVAAGACSDDPPANGVNDLSDASVDSSNGNPTNGDASSSKDGANDDAASGPEGLLVQKQAGSSTDALSLKVTLAKKPANGSALILAVAGSIDPPTTVTGGGVTWTRQAFSNSNIPTSVWSGFAVANGDVTITLAFDRLQSFATALVTEWSGLGAFGTKTESSGLTAAINPTAIDASGARLVFATVGTKKHAATIGAAAGFSSLETVSVGTLQLLSAYKEVSTGTIAPTWTSDAPDKWDAVVVTFKP